MKAILDLVQHELFTVLYRPVQYRTVIPVQSYTVLGSNSCTEQDSKKAVPHS